MNRLSSLVEGPFTYKIGIAKGDFFFNITAGLIGLESLRDDCDWQITPSADVRGGYETYLFKGLPYKK